MGLTRVVTDTFTEGVATALTAHTADTGQSWNNWNGSTTVRAAGYASNNNTASGNRGNITTGVGGPYFDVSAEITIVAGGTTTKFVGVSGRHSAFTNTNGYEFSYDQGLGGYALNAANAQVDFSAAALPVAGTKLTLRFRPTVVEGLANDVVVVSTTTMVNETSEVAGFIVGSFAGSGSLDTVRVDNFTVDLWSPDTLTLLPTADVADGGWLNEAGTNVDLFASLADPSASTWVQSSLTSGTDVLSVTLANPGGTPDAGTVTLNIRYGAIAS